MFQLNFNFFDFHRDFSPDDDDDDDDCIITVVVGGGGCYYGWWCQRRNERMRMYIYMMETSWRNGIRLFCFRYVMPYVIYICACMYECIFFRNKRKRANTTKKRNVIKASFSFLMGAHMYDGVGRKEGKAVCNEKKKKIIFSFQTFYRTTVSTVLSYFHLLCFFMSERQNVK